MIAASIDQASWIETFRALLHYCMPPLESTPLVNVAGLAAVGAGLFLVFQSGKFERMVVCAIALVVGGWLGYRLSLLVNSPGPISVAIMAVIISIVAYKTFRWWLALGSVLVLFGVAVLFQIGRGGLNENLLKPDQLTHAARESQVQLLSAEEQMRNLHPNTWDQLDKVKDSLYEALKKLGPTGWVIPGIAALAGGLLAYWALNVFVIVWLGFLGANLSVIGGATVLCANWPNMRDSVIGHPQIPAGIAIGLWLLGLILQAKKSRFPKKTARKDEKDSSQS